MNSKRKKLWEGDDDRINYLPNELLYHILLFLPTIDSVSICILCKRWKHLWKYVPRLNFDDSCLHPSKYARFADIVNSILSVHIPRVKVLEKFSLTCHQMTQLYDAPKWISSSIIRNIQSLDLNIIDRSGMRFVLTSNMFSCKTLESLTLQGNIRLIVDPSNVCLPKLMTLKLVDIEYQDYPVTRIPLCSSLESLHIEQYTSFRGYFCMVSNRGMLSSTLRHIKLIDRYARETVMVPSNVFTFQTLEKLILQGCFFISALPTTICMPNLTLLELVGVRYQDDQIFNTLISNCTSLESLNVANISMEAEVNISSCTLKVIELKLIGRSNAAHKLVINAPAIKYLKLNVVGGMIDYQFEELPSLEQAVVAIQFDRGISHEYCSTSLMNINKALQHVKSLKVEHSPKGCGFGHALPMFTRLTELDISIHRHKCIVFLEFINNSTKLEKLSLNGWCGVSWSNPNSVPACLLTTLRSVSITSFRGGAGMTLMAKYFIENARILEIMKICFDLHSLKKKAPVSKKIVKFSRASKKCVILIK